MSRFLILTTIALTCGLACAREEAPVAEPVPQAAEAPEPVSAHAMAMLQPRADTTVGGELHFNQTGDGPVEIEVHITGAPPGTHGIHIHEAGDCSAEDFTSAGGHFNPADAPHGGPDDAERHAGDLGNIEIAEDGTGHLSLESELLSLTPGDAGYAVGRGVILHEKADDLVSQPTGAAGSRLACGVIESAG